MQAGVARGAHVQLERAVGAAVLVEDVLLAELVELFALLPAAAAHLLLDLHDGMRNVRSRARTSICAERERGALAGRAAGKHALEHAAECAGDGQATRAQTGRMQECVNSKKKEEKKSKMPLKALESNTSKPETRERRALPMPLVTPAMAAETKKPCAELPGMNFEPLFQ
jgi:hypothetical protein